jgi:hypothetical protein
MIAQPVSCGAYGTSRWLFLILFMALLAPIVHGQSLTVQQGMAFGSIAFSGNPQSGNIPMGTNGTVMYGSSTDGNGFGTPAQLTIGGDVDTVVDIRCSDSATLAHSSGNTLTLSPIKMSLINGQTFSAATTCAGLATSALSHTVSANAALNTLWLGGQLQTHGQNVANGAYGTHVPGGNAITVQVIIF